MCSVLPGIVVSSSCLSPVGIYEHSYCAPLAPRSLLFRIMLQRRLGLNITKASAACDAEERNGGVADRQGDNLANAGKYTRRPGGTTRASVPFDVPFAT